MKNILKYTILSLLIGGAVVSCEKYNEPEPLTIQRPDVKSPDYYANLRAYKLSDHAVSFGWFGGWTAQGPSMKSFMAGLPDSLDIISLWSGNPYTEASKADLDFIQNVKGTRVCACLLLGWNNKGLKGFTGEAEPWPTDPVEREAALRLYADNLAKQYIEDGYQGFDIDYEPNIGTWMDVQYCPVGEDFVIFVDQLGKYFGPKSGTNRLLMIDGELWAPPAACAPYFNYAIAQAYGNSGPSCQSRYDQIEHLFKPEQFIITEDFEKYWDNGGQVLSQAAWNPTQGRKGGCGTFHMENDYNHTDMQYKWLRKAIQIMNPAIVTSDGSYNPAAYIGANTNNTFHVDILRTPVGDKIETPIEFPIVCTRELPGDLTVTLAQNNDLVEAYNLANATFYTPAPEGLITIVNNGVTIPAGSVKSTDNISIEFGEDLSQFATEEQNGYLLPVEIARIDGKATTSRDRNVAYIIIKVKYTNMKAADAAASDAKADRTGWTAESDQAANFLPNLFDDDTSSRWPSSYWNTAPTYFTVDMGEVKTLKGLEYTAYGSYYGSYGYEEVKISTSEDGTTWTLQGSVQKSGGLQFVEFYGPVACRYIKTETVSLAYYYDYFALTEFNVYL